ncbi:MAG: hypothetical protein DCF15_02885 [Phormidesmis priestleyi]|uniref:Uncharacterized protein n=1 Tax=Phormidesmis priestleyi TaxID=268141 RepID=A0A2W4XRI6_9CYAN|nr:MAG: hypothetical protein DCF15_02885 [Phormidesmis priestleyi]
MSADKQTRHTHPRKKPSDLQRLGRRFMSGLLRSLLLIHKPARAGQAGFVLPTTVLLLLVLTLTVGTLSFRTFSRSSSVIALREQQVVDSAAAPAIDRAKAKLEYLFSKDTRFPGGIPSSDVIASMMLNDNVNVPRVPGTNDPYTFPLELRLDINGDNVPDNAWSFPSDVDGNGSQDGDELVVYSILMDDAKTPAGGGADITLAAPLSSTKAGALVTRNGPISTKEAKAGCGSELAPEDGWQVVNAATLQKNFQITAFVANRSNVNRTATAIELQQVRQANRGNKWGAWFKYDLELFPGAAKTFYWNGAMHTEGNFLTQDEKSIARMISSHNSCLYTQDSSEITLADPSGDYQGQVLSAKTGTNAFGDSPSGAPTVDDDPTFHLFTYDAQAPDQSTNGSMRLRKDSVKKNSTNETENKALRNILLDPIQLFTADVLAHRSSADWIRDPSWEGGLFAKNKRIYNDQSATPYLDDTYRADDRYGPKAVYDRNHKIPSGSSIGTAITGNAALTDLNAASKIYGLDGYWERRAIGQGLRIIVGQRLELGNTFGWKGSSASTATNQEPLYPPNAKVSTEALQRRSLYDNLAAVQGMVVYHYKHTDGGELPLACMASTAHPGTLSTITKSRTFTEYPGTTNLQVDFLTGNGTNGWEFDFYSSFSSKIAATEPLGVALRNLAYFAGDPQGGAPSFTPDQSASVVHPYPHQAMWGDFSNLRRVLDSGTTYTNLSPADKSTLHTAACTIGLLAYSMDTQLLSGPNVLKSYLPQSADANNLGQSIFNALGLIGNPSAPPSGCTSVVQPVTVTNIDDGVSSVSSAYEYDCRNLVINKETVISALNPTGGLSPATARTSARLLSNLGQIQRDRTYGFLPSNSTNFSNYIVKASSGNTKYLVRIPDECSPNKTSEIQRVFTSYGVAGGLDESRAGMALMCTPAGPKYPSLYYLFPERDHSQVGSGTYAQPLAEEYINQTYLIDAINGVNRNVTYKVVGDSNSSGIADTGDTGIASIKLSPRLVPDSDWKLPTAPITTGSFNPESLQISANGALTEVSMLDKGMYDGREMLNLRMLDLDIRKLADKVISTDRLISITDGIVYAFREDAIREDAIVRPKASTVAWEGCDTWSEVYTHSTSTPFQVTGNQRDCRLKKLSSSPYLQDPPLMTGTKISTKPIDFYADPDRRPYGFRLVNGATLNRDTGVTSGMTFVSDNMVYTKGDFNLHTSTGALDPIAATACSNLLEEFTDKLIASNCSLRTNIDFYTDRTIAERNNSFAKAASDKWRPVEIVGDAVGILSGSFRDGNIADGFVLSRTGNKDLGAGTSSYQNQNRRLADTTVANWTRINPNALVSDNTVPILIDRNGGVVKSDGLVLGANDLATTPTTNEYLRFDVDGLDSASTVFSDKRGQDMERATRTIVNAVFISGIVPSQAGQTYGGMHNFPRFIEHWDGVDLHLSGGLFQLNFSTSATAPFDQDAWEPYDPAITAASTNAAPNGDARIAHFRTRFYGAPNRIWGYDVGLQYAPAGPIARRFITIGRPRSEFYRELPVDDHYVKNLRCATSGGTRIYPNESC